MVCTIPFGLPVDPEVYNINKGSSASIISGSQSLDAASNKGCNHSSLPSSICISSLVLLVTKTHSILSQCSKASSAIPLMSIDFFPLYEPSEVISSLQLESLILIESAVDENHPNTTECIAPILAQAKIATVNSGIIGR